MSRASEIRQWLSAQDGPRTSRQIADGMGCDPIKAQWAVGVMLRDGLLRRVRAAKPCTYVMLRDALPMDERLRRAAAGLKARVKDPAMEQARREAAAIRRRERDTASKARRRKREAEKRAYDKARYQAQSVAVKRYVAILESKPVEPPKPAIVVQTVEEWLAAGGHVERVGAAWDQGARL